VTLKSTGQTPIVMSATYHHCYFWQFWKGSNLHL
jgi:hypothetical protein